MGNPFINAVYIGHPGWKAMGGRIGYSAATGIVVIILSWFGIISVMSALIPVIAISPIRLSIGMLIGAQVFPETPKAHAPAIVLALTPNLARVGQAPDRQLARRGRHQRGRARPRQAAQVGVLYDRLAILGGLVLGAMGAFIVDRDFTKAAAFAFAGAVLTFFGFMHGEAIGIARTPMVALAYLLVAGWLFGCAKYATASSPAPVRHAPPAAVPVD